MKKYFILKIVYGIVCGLIIIGLLYPVVIGLIYKADIVQRLLNMLFFIMGIPLGIIFAFLNTIFYIKHRNIVFLILSVVSFLWMAYSVYCWIFLLG
jgi:hypothetical protein